MADESKVRRLGPIVAVVAIAVVLIGGAIAAYLMAGGGPAGSDGDSGRVKIEIRARPVATITFRGKKLGRTPLVIHLPRSKTPETLEATFEVHKMHLATRTNVTEKKTVAKEFVPDADQSVDFDVKDAK